MTRVVKIAVGRKSEKGVAARGFALLTVIWVVAIVSVIAMQMVASVSAEARIARDRLDALRAARLAAGGHAVADYLGQVGHLLDDQEVAELPVSVLADRRRYRAVFPAGTAEIEFESENGKYSLAQAPEEALARLFSIWRGTSGDGAAMASAVASWRDPARGGRIGVGDAHRIPGFAPEDFQPRIVSGPRQDSAWILTAGLYSLVTPLPTGDRINPNYAPAIVLESIPGMPRDLAARILLLRDEGRFETLNNFAQRTGIAAGSALANALLFDDGAAPSVRVRARLGDGPEQYERRIYHVYQFYRPETGFWTAERVLHTRHFYSLQPVLLGTEESSSGP